MIKMIGMDLSAEERRGSAAWLVAVVWGGMWRQSYLSIWPAAADSEVPADSGQNWFVINTLTLSHQPSLIHFRFQIFQPGDDGDRAVQSAIARSTQHTRVPASIPPSRHTTGASVNTQDDEAHVICIVMPDTVNHSKITACVVIAWNDRTLELDTNLCEDWNSHSWSFTIMEKAHTFVS